MKALRKQFRRMDVYEEDCVKADIILFNSNPSNYETMLRSCFDLRKRFKKTVIHRLAGPIFLARGKDFLLDRIIYHFNYAFCDGSIFQSDWSRQQNFRLGMKPKPHEIVIPNAPDPEMFHPCREKKTSASSKVRLISSSWSANMKKGFDIYKFLDENLDFRRYGMSFYGNSPIEFKNIMTFAPVPSSELARALRESDIFISASTFEACSNSLLEALHCGLPVVVRAGTSDCEIAGEAGVTFEGRSDVLEAIGLVSMDINRFKECIRLPGLSEVSDRYYEFCRDVHYEVAGERRRARYMDLLWIRTLARLHSTSRRFRGRFARPR